MQWFFQVQQLQRAHLKSAVKVAVNKSYKLVATLTQYMIAIPFMDRVSLLYSLILLAIILIDQLNLSRVPRYHNILHKTS